MARMLSHRPGWFNALVSLLRWLATCTSEDASSCRHPARFAAEATRPSLVAGCTNQIVSPDGKGAVGCTAVGVLSLVSGSGWVDVLGVWLVGAGINYIPLALQAQSLSRPGALEAELHGLDLRNELRRAGVRQLWIAVPFAVAMSALAEVL